MATGKHQDCGCHGQTTLGEGHEMAERETGMPTGSMNGQGATNGSNGVKAPSAGNMPGSAGMSTGGGSGGSIDAPAAPQRKCGTMDVHRRLLSTSPEYAAARSRIETESQLMLRSARDMLRAGVKRIPVVVHVVFNTAAQNVSDAQVQSQIDVLNRDFRKANTDVGAVPAPFKPLVADAEVEFFLTTQAPDGSPHSGITRTSTTVTSFSDDDRVKSTATGGTDAWPADRYLNLWVCPLGGGLLGYAQFPGGAAATDGVVINYTAFGTTGTATAPFHLGRTATHEVGHYLNLFHIWGDDGTGCGGSDEVADTPNQAGPNVGAPAFPHVSCGNAPNGDLFVNYMDYVDDPAMVMFTTGQATRMQACLAGPRASLSTGAGILSHSGPVVSWGANRVDAFVVGTNGACFHKWQNGTTWGPSETDYESLGGVCTTAVEAVAWGPNRLDLFVVGTDSRLYHKWWSGSAWGPSMSAWETLGGTCTSTPKAVSWGSDRLDVFVLGTDSRLYHKWWNGSAWGPSVTGFEDMAGTCLANPEAVAWGPNRLTSSCSARTTRCITSGGTGRRGGPRSPVTSPWAGRASEHPGCAPGVPTVWTSSCSAPIAPSTTSGGTGRRGGPPSPATST